MRQSAVNAMKFVIIKVKYTLGQTVGKNKKKITDSVE